LFTYRASFDRLAISPALVDCESQVHHVCPMPGVRIVPGAVQCALCLLLACGHPVNVAKHYHGHGFFKVFQRYGLRKGIYRRKGEGGRGKSDGGRSKAEGGSSKREGGICSNDTEEIRASERRVRDVWIFICPGLADGVKLMQDLWWGWSALYSSRCGRGCDPRPWRGSPGLRRRKDYLDNGRTIGVLHVGLEVAGDLLLKQFGVLCEYGVVEPDVCTSG
jgi:hypothetical protein